MKVCLRKIISVLAAFAIVGSLLIAPVLAEEYDSRVTSFWDSYLIKGISTSTNVPFLDGVCKNIAGTFSGAICAGASPDNLHHGSIVSEGELGGTDKAGYSYLWVKCKYCGDMFKGYASDLSAAYDNYVSALPATGYDSSGSITWSPKLKWIGFDVSGVFHFLCPHYSGDISDNSKNTFNVTFDCANQILTASPKVNNLDFYFRGYVFDTQDVFPIDGYYTQIASPILSGYYLVKTGEKFSYSANYSAEINSLYRVGGTECDFNSTRFASFTYSSNMYYFSANFYGPVYKIVPVSALSGDAYNINTRPTSITGGNYGIVGDNGQITKVEDNSTIINETNNTYYNPATGQTAPITNWSYDYSDRSYKLTLDGGKTSSVTYGDENITITETTVNESGDTITNNYTIYYLIDGSGSENPPSGCEHTWTETSSTPATCIMPGSKLLTCSKCQQTRKEAIPALGHDWQEKQTVTTQYDETGQLVQKGYTIFECSRCHEQYKSEDGTGPPDTPPENPGEEEEKQGFFAWLWSVLTDALKKLIEGIIDAILKTLDFFFGGDSQSNYDFYNSPSTFSGVSVWGS